MVAGPPRRHPRGPAAVTVTPDSLAPVMTLASGNRPMNRRPPRSGRSRMSVLRSNLDAGSAEFAANRDAMLARLADIDALHATAVAGGGPEVHRAAPPTRQAARPPAHRAAPRRGCPVPRAQSAGRLWLVVHRWRQRRHRHRCRQRCRMPDQRQRSDGERRGEQPVHVAQGLPCGRHRLPEPSPDDPPRRVRRRRPAHPEGHLHPRRANVPRPDSRVRPRDPVDLHRLRQLDCRRRLPAGDVRSRRHGQGAGQGVPGRSAVAEDGHGRGGRRRVARRGRDALADLRALRPPRRRRA